MSFSEKFSIFNFQFSKPSNLLTHEVKLAKLHFLLQKYKKKRKEKHGNPKKISKSEKKGRKAGKTPLAISRKGGKG